MITETLRVALPDGSGRSAYDIIIGAGLLRAVGQLIGDRLGLRSCCIIADTTVARLYEAPLRAACEQAGHRLQDSIIVPAGETSKTWDQFRAVVDGMIARKVDRKTLVLALGGGVVGDLAGFAAAITLRGLDVVQIPTTLLAMVDSAVGGKTAIDHAAGKNLIGAFHQPRLVISDLDVLKTLPLRELRAGYAETVKYGLLGDAAFYDWCESHAAKFLAGDATLLAYAVHHSCAMKADIVARDERENGVRALLNLGHTFGHALETSAGYGASLLHGEAVAIGITLAARLSERLGHLEKGLAARIENRLASAGLPVAATLRDQKPDPDDMIRLMQQDKKAEDGKLTFVLLKGIGKAFVQKDVDTAIVQALLRSL